MKQGQGLTNTREEKHSLLSSDVSIEYYWRSYCTLPLLQRLVAVDALPLRMGKRQQTRKYCNSISATLALPDAVHIKSKE